jgi:ectoine hydroxylase-related dioxygenase (phytanoyl-CoA dioxygenase family)
MYPSPRAVLPGNALAGVPRHTDRQYNQHMSHFLTVWAPIDCFDPEMGGVIVHPGSHRMLTPPTEQRTPGGLWFSETGAVAQDSGVLQVLRRGDALLIDEHLLHASAPNRSTRTRLSIDLRVFGDHGVTTKHYLDCQDWTVYAPPAGKRHAS